MIFQVANALRTHGELHAAFGLAVSCCSVAEWFAPKRESEFLFELAATLGDRAVRVNTYSSCAAFEWQSEWQSEWISHRL